MKATLLTKKEDYEELGLSPHKIELWEDGRRSTQEKNTWEWWYFDSILDDGTKVVIQFFTKGSGHTKSAKDYPMCKMTVTTADKKEYFSKRDYSIKEASWSKKLCDVTYGPDYFRGDYKEYDINMSIKKGVGAKLHLISESKPYRPGTGYFNFGSRDRFYTWFCSMPKCRVEGTLTLDGKTVEVHGKGYHDHQWGNVNFLNEWGHWVWARQSFEDYSLLIFDMISNEKTGWSRFPICFVEDASGNLVFENFENVECVIDRSYADELTGKAYPDGIHYKFNNGKQTLEYDLKQYQIIECQGVPSFPKPAQLVMKAKGINASYTRYMATGAMRLYANGKKEDVLERKSDLIYEFMYPGNDYRGHM